MTTDFRALCAELTDDLEAWVDGYLINDYPDEATAESFERINRARAALDEPEPPADGEVAELVGWLRQEAQQHADSWPDASAKATRLAEFVERLAPQPEAEGPSTDELHQVFLDYARDFCKEKVLSPGRFCVAARAVLARWGTPNLTQVRSSLGDGPAVPAGREPASVNTEVTDEAGLND